MPISGTKRVNLRVLSEIARAPHPGIQDCAIKLVYTSKPQDRTEYLFKDLSHALMAVIHHCEVEELGLWADEGQNEHGEIEPYIHFVDIESMFEGQAEAGICLMVTESGSDPEKEVGLEERIYLHLVPFTLPTDTIGI